MSNSDLDTMTTILKLKQELKSDRKLKLK